MNKNNGFILLFYIANLLFMFQLEKAGSDFAVE